MTGTAGGEAVLPPGRASVRLFDDIERSDRGPAYQAEPRFDYMNRTARSTFVRARSLLESWFERYPDAEKPDLLGRFRSSLDDQHASACFELFLHELLLRLGCAVEIHPPPGPDTRRRPDFLVHLPGGDRFYLEASLATGSTREERATEARLRAFYDVLNGLESPDYFLMIRADGFEPKTPIPASKVRNLVRRWLETLDYEQVLRVAVIAGLSALPSVSFEHESWTVTIQALPKKRETRGRPGVRPIGTFPTRVQWGNRAADALKEAVLFKASRYKVLDLPYVVAVHAMGPFLRQTEVEAVLFGRQTEPPVDLDARARTVGCHGAWTGPTGPKHTRVSGVLAVLQYYPWALEPTSACLYLNPWASKPLAPISSRIAHAEMGIDGLHVTRGEPVLSVLGLPGDWPGPDDLRDG
jgi:hypothetical protein